MVNPYMKAPHADPARALPPEAPNAALLIDFDNVTMGMRSDLAKELKRLLDADIIKGKVTVQRAYADWRRYPQYIVPLSEASIDLIFAPAYGSSKKNATDIRMAIDGMELVFIRPEIGTFILLTGDSDFSSLVLKLKEYGKYVVGIGIQESTSDILVQNCDEYYSYTSLAGLSKTSEADLGEPDAWQCVEEAVGRMVSRGDVMRSDRLKQVMIEVWPGFDERGLGFKNFSKFLIEAANKGLVTIERGANGQYLVAPPDSGTDTAPPRKRAPEAAAAEARHRGKERRAPAARRGPSGRVNRNGRGVDAPAEASRATAGRDAEARRDPGPALDLLGRAVRELAGQQRASSVRDSDLKRKMLAIEKDFDESAFGFSKFSKFLQFAEGEGTVALARMRDGSLKVRLADEKPAEDAPFDARALGLPVSETSIKSYLANRYKGVGVKTAERLVEHFGTDVFSVLHGSPERVEKVLSRARAENVLANWAGDYKRKRKEAAAKAAASPARSGGRPAGAAAVPAGGRRTGGAPAPRTGSRAGSPRSRGPRTSPGQASRAAAPARHREDPPGQSRLPLRETSVANAPPGAGGGDDSPQSESGAGTEGGAEGKSRLRNLLPWGRRKRGRGGAGN